MDRLTASLLCSLLALGCTMDGNGATDDAGFWASSGGRLADAGNIGGQAEGTGGAELPATGGADGAGGVLPVDAGATGKPGGGGGSDVADAGPDADVEEQDSDGDGIPDDIDSCPLDPDNDVDADGACGDVDPCPTDRLNDQDDDGACDSVDPCPLDAEDDADGDGLCGDVDPDACHLGDQDEDGNGWADACDQLLWSSDASGGVDEALLPLQSAALNWILWLDDGGYVRATSMPLVLEQWSSAECGDCLKLLDHLPSRAMTRLHFDSAAGSFDTDSNNGWAVAPEIGGTPVRVVASGFVSGRFGRWDLRIEVRGYQ